jgi:hypothetical protein
MHFLNRALLCCITILIFTLADAEDNLENILRRADRIVSLRDRVVSEYSAWSPEYAKEDAQLEKEQGKLFESFCERFNVKLAPAAISKRHKGLQIRFVSLSNMFPKEVKANAATVLELSSGKLLTGPDISFLKQESSQTGMPLNLLLAREVQKSGDLAITGPLFLIPSGRFAVLDKKNPQYYSGIDLSGQVQRQDPTCILAKEQVLIIETLQKKYALVQFLGTYNSQILLCVIYQPDGSAVFEFEVMSRPPVPDLTKLAKDENSMNPQDVAKMRYVLYRAVFFEDEVRALSKSLKDAMQNGNLTKDQQQRLSQIKIKLGLSGNENIGSK